MSGGPTTQESQRSGRRPRVRRATVADAPAIGAVHMRSWQETYARLLPAGALDALDPVHSGERWAATMASGGADVWVALADGDIVGFAVSGPSADERAPRRMQLLALYVLTAWHGSGAGQGLLDAALGDRAAHLWVAADNPRAEAFYRRNGFTPDGATDTHELAGHPVPAVHLVR